MTERVDLKSVTRGFFGAAWNFVAESVGAC